MVALPYNEVMTIPGYMTVEQAAEYLGISESGVHYHLRSGNLPGATKVGGAWLIPEGEVRAIKGIKPGPKPKTEG